MGLKQPYFAYGLSLGTLTSTRYWCLFAHQNSLTVTTAGRGTQLVHHAVTIRNWLIRLTTAPGSGVTRRFRIYHNGSASAFDVSIVGTNQTGSYVAGDLALAAGDTVYVEETVTGGTPADAHVQSVIEVEGPDNVTSLWGVGSNVALASAGTTYDGPFCNGDWGITAGRVESIAAAAGTITGYRILLSVAPGAAASGKSRTFVIEKNGVTQDGSGGTPDTTIPISETATSGSASFSLAVSPLDLLRVKQTPANSPAIATAIGSGTFVATTAGKMNLGFTSDDGLPPAATEYSQALGKGHVWGATEADRELIGPTTPVELSGLYADLPVAPGSGNSYDFTFRVNAADSAQTVSVAGTATTGGPSGGAVVTITSSDRFALRVVPVSGPTLSYARLAFLMTDPVAAAASRFNALLIAP